MQIYLFSHLADAFIQSDLQMRTLLIHPVMKQVKLFMSDSLTYAFKPLFHNFNNIFIFLFIYLLCTVLSVNEYTPFEK